MREDSGQPPKGFDVVVCGGGLAGLTLALQLRHEAPGASVAVVDKARRPLPEACHKVGESTVELGAHYLADVVGLRPYLEREQLPKNGLRFFTEGGALPLQERSEIGPSDFPVVPSFQVDRGKLENDLRDMCEQQGVTLLEGRTVADVDIAEGDAPNTVRLEGDLAPHALQARWIVDATGRRRLIQRKLGLHLDSDNRQSAAWFRVPGHVKVNDLVPDSERTWHQKDVDDNRWLSTNHLMGRGYWVWLIPLGTGFTSIGIVADAGCHPFERYNRPEQAHAWLAEHEPRLAEHIADLEFADFRVLRHYSYFSERLLSTDRWICVGEAGVFVDPLYSPGTDFIGIGNGFASRLIADDVGGRFDPQVAEELNRFGLRAARDGMNSLSGNADVFQHGKTMGSKLWWDFFSYWSFLCQYFAQGIYRLPLEQLRRFHRIGEQFFALNEQANRLVRTWARLRGERLEPERKFVPGPLFPSILADKHLALQETISPEALLRQLEADLDTGRELIAELLIRALRDIGPEGAAELGRDGGLTEGGLPLDADRLEVDALPRRERRDRLTRVARDLERAFGRATSETPLEDLVSLARGESNAGADRPLASESSLQ